ncbi:MAG: hypothetical protein ACRCR1_03530 [Aeromonas sp.]
MALSEWVEWHLTPNGWVKGSTKYEFEGVKRVPEPIDRVKTCIVSEKIHSGALGLDREIMETWSDHGQPDKINSLLEEFGGCPFRC